MPSLFQSPDELIISPLTERFPCRDLQIRSLSTLLCPCAAPCRNIILYGTEATGKSSIVNGVLQGLASLAPQADTLRYAILNSVQCITARHLFERTLSAVAESLQWEPRSKRCDSAAQLTVELSKMLKYAPRPDGWRFVLVFDSIDRQRDASPLLLPALGRLSEVIPCLTCVFVLTSPPAGVLRFCYAPHIYFPNYSKAEFTRILSARPPDPLLPMTQDDILFLWPRFCNAVHDSLTSTASRTLSSFRHICQALWPRFTAPILAGTHGPREFSKLVIAARIHFQDESLLNLGIISTPKSTTKPTSLAAPPSAALIALLPTAARLLLLAAYLASHNASKHDLTLFSTYHHGRRRRRGGGLIAPRSSGTRGPKHRKISRKLLGAHAFVLERMMAIFASVRSEWASSDTGSAVGASGLDADIGMALSTLASLRLLVRIGAAADLLERGGKWRINVGWEVIRGVGRSMGVELEDWLID